METDREWSAAMTPREGPGRGCDCHCHCSSLVGGEPVTMTCDRYPSVTPASGVGPVDSNEVDSPTRSDDRGPSPDRPLRTIPSEPPRSRVGCLQPQASSGAEDRTSSGEAQPSEQLHMGSSNLVRPAGGRHSPLETSERSVLSEAARRTGPTLGSVSGPTRREVPPIEAATVWPAESAAALQSGHSERLRLRLRVGTPGR